MSILKVYLQRHWTDQELVADGFHAYRPVKRITMARRLPPDKAPKIIKTSWATLTAPAGYWIAYVAGEALAETLDDYQPRPIEPHIFAETYRPWYTPTWKRTPTEAHLQRLGCQPYFKIAGVWAKQLASDAWVQSMESGKPSRAPKGEWLCVGTEGEPWSVTAAWFHARYLL